VEVVRLVAAYTIWIVLCWCFLRAGMSSHQLPRDIISNVLQNAPLAKYKVKTPWNWCSCTETCRSTYDI